VWRSYRELGLLLEGPLVTIADNLFLGRLKPTNEMIRRAVVNPMPASSRNFVKAVCTPILRKLTSHKDEGKLPRSFLQHSAAAISAGEFGTWGEHSTPAVLASATTTWRPFKSIDPIGWKRWRSRFRSRIAGTNGREFAAKLGWRAS
jgi:hypothetical protein